MTRICMDAAATGPDDPTSYSTEDHAQDARHDAGQCNQAQPPLAPLEQLEQLPPLVDDVIETLDQFERHVLLLYYVECLTPMEIGAALCVPGQRVYAALSELKQRMSSAMRERHHPITTCSPALHHPNLNAASDHANASTTRGLTHRLTASHS